MSGELSKVPEYGAAMRALEALKHTTADGADFWMAREIHPVLGYAVWDKFEPVIGRAREALIGNGLDASHHIAQTSKMMGVGRGAQRPGIDHFLSRAAAYLIAMNGDPSKPEIAAAQAYFAIQTRRMEEADSTDNDAKRLELRAKVGQSHKLVSAVAQEAGVRNHMQGIFHDARYRGLYGMSLKEVKARKGIPDKDQLYDVAGPLELSANDFQMNLAAEVIRREKIRGETKTIATNESVGKRVRRAMADSGQILPEALPMEPPIKEIQKRLGKQPRLTDPDGSSTA